MTDQKTPTLSYPTIVAGAVAAATATALSTQMGLVGTILGAALASVVSGVVTHALAGWISRMHSATRDRDPAPIRQVLVGVVGIVLVVMAFHTGLDLFTRGLPTEGFAGRLVAQMGLR
jgi:hypothetical protein